MISSGALAHEVRIAELGIDALDVGVDLGDLLLQPRLLGRDVDDALERQRRDLAAHDAAAPSPAARLSA